MSNAKLKAITAREENFAQWYTDVVLKAGLASYSGVKGCVYIPPYGTAVWDNLRSEFDRRLKDLGYSNVMFPLLMPKSLLQKEKDHVSGFSPEVATITHSGENKLGEPLLIRPTSEALFCDYFASTLQSYKELPLRFNQWANIVRMEKNTRPFLRTTEFFWQEGHALFASADEAQEEAKKIHQLYADFCKDVLALPVLSGAKTESEKFAGAVDTYTVESMMWDGQALQTATSHYLGDGFMRAFDVKVQGKEGKEIYPHYVTFGISTRSIGGVIMVHGDDNGLVLPPAIAPVQIVIIPIQQQKDGVLDATQNLAKELGKKFRVHLDSSGNSLGWKFSEWEMKGVPLRLELGPRDIEAGSCVVVKRNTGEKITVNIKDLLKQVELLLSSVNKEMYVSALERLEARVFPALTLTEIQATLKNKQGFVRAPWCGSLKCEDEMKKQAGLTSRCIVGATKDKCSICAKAGKHSVIWGRAY